MENNINIQLYSSCNCICDFCLFKDKLYNKISPKFVLDYLEEHDNINYVVLTGGEPTFAIEEYKTIVESLKNKTIVLQTNGWWGNNEFVKDVIRNFPPTIVHLSVDKEKQKMISLSTVISAYNHLVKNNITTYVVNHTKDDYEFLTYQKDFPEVVRGKIVCDDGNLSHDCGLALLADNTVGKLDIKGWRC